MDTTVLTNILFASLSAFLIVLIIAFLAFAWAGILFLRKLSLLVSSVHRASEKMIEDVEAVRERIKSGEAAMASFFWYAANFLKDNWKKIKRQ